MGQVLTLSVELFDLLLFSLDVGFGFSEHCLVTGNVALDFSSLSKDILEFSLLGVNGSHNLIAAGPRVLLLDLVPLCCELNDLFFTLDKLNLELLA